MKKLKYIFLFLLVLSVYLFIGTNKTNAIDYVPLYDALFENKSITLYTDAEINDINSLSSSIYDFTNTYRIIEYYNSGSDYSDLGLNYECSYDTMTCSFRLYRGRPAVNDYITETLKEYENIAIVIDSNVDQYFEMIENNNLIINYDEDMFATEQEKESYIYNYMYSFNVYDYNYGNNSSISYNYDVWNKKIKRVEQENNFPTKIIVNTIDGVVFDYTEEPYSDDFKRLTSGTITIKSDSEITQNILSDSLPWFSGIHFQIDGNIVNNKVFIKMNETGAGQNVYREKHLITLVQDDNIDLDKYEIPGFRTSATIKAAEPENNVSEYLNNYFSRLSLYYEDGDINYQFRRLYDYENTDYVIIRYQKSENGNVLDTQYHKIPVNFVGYDNEVSEKYSELIGDEITIHADSLDSEIINRSLNYNAYVLSCNNDYSSCDIGYFDYDTRKLEIHKVNIILDNSISNEFISEFGIENNEIKIVLGNDVVFQYGMINYNKYNESTHYQRDFQCNIVDENSGFCTLTLRNYEANKAEIHDFDFSVIRSNRTESYQNLVKDEIDVYPGEEQNVWSRLNYSYDQFRKTNDNSGSVHSIQCNQNNSTCSVITLNQDNRLEVHNSIVHVHDGRSPEFDETFPGDTIHINSIYSDDEDYLYRASEGMLTTQSKAWSYLQTFENGVGKVVFKGLETHTMNVTFEEGNNEHKAIVDEVIDEIGDEYRIVKIDDMEFVNRFYYNLDFFGQDTSTNYNSKIINDTFNDLINNKHISYYLALEGGIGDYFFETAGGKVILYYDGIAYGMTKSFVEISLNQIIYIPDDTPNTKEAFIAAAQARIDEYLGENSGVIVEFSRPLDNMNYDERYIDPTGSDNNAYKLIYKGRTTDFLICKNSSKMKTLTFIASDVNNNINVSSETAIYPSNTIVSSNILNTYPRFAELLNASGLTNLLVVDINLFSPTLGDINEFGDFEFDVEVPIDIKLIAGKKLFAYYITETGKIEKHPITLNDFIAKFRTDHFSPYAIVAEDSDVTTNLDEVDFGEVTVGFERVDKKITVINNSEKSVTLSITNPTSTGPFGNLSFDTEEEVAPGEEFEITLLANPSSPFATIPNTYEGTYVITANEVDGDNTYTLNIPAKVVVNPRQPISVAYTTHVQYYGWQDYVKDGVMAGTSGEAKRLEAIKIKLNNQDYDGDILYRTHIQSYGWENEFKKNDEMSGTSGESKRLEAIEIKLDGEIANHYDIYYRVHAQRYGWLGWARNGEPAGTAGYAFRLEGIEIKLVPKGATFEDYGKEAIFYNVDSGPVKPLDNSVKIAYTTHVQAYGWQDYVKDGEMAGTSGEAKRLEAIRIKLNNPEYDGDIEYRTHIQSYGWEEGFKKNDEMSGTSGESKRLEAIEIKLTGEMAEHYDVYYRVHSQRFGWLGWAKNGEKSGTAGFGFRLEGIEIELVEKGSEFSKDDDLETFLERNGWVTWNNKTYYYYEDGSMAKYIAKIGDTRYEFSKDGELQHSNIKLVADVSYHNGDIDFDTLWNSKEIDEIIFRVGYAGHLDTKFEEYLAEAKRLGIPYSIYQFSYAEDENEAETEANSLVKWYKDYDLNPTMGVFYDIEGWNTSRSSSDHITVSDYDKIIQKYKQILTDNGIEMSLYTGKYYAETRLSDFGRSLIAWIAHYNNNCLYMGPYRGWQYTATGKLPGITGNVDLSIFYY